MPFGIGHHRLISNVLKLKNIILFITLLSGIGFSGRAQEMHGYVHGNYAGITGSLINPTSILTSKVYLDINLLGLHLNVDNNYIYLAKDEYKFNRFLSADPEFPKHIDEITGDEREYYDRYNTDLKNAYTQIRVLGPSAMFASGQQAFGLSTGYRILVSGNSIPFDIAKFAVEGLDYIPQQRINYINEIDFRMASMALAEISGSYSRILHRKNREYLAAGFTIKGLFSSGGAFGYAENIDYMVPNSDTLIVYNANGKFGTSIPVDYNNNDVLIPDQLFTGKGVGFDVGFTYQKMLRGHSTKSYSSYCEIPYQPYIFRLGVSLLDVGSVKYKKNAAWVEMENASANWENVRGADYQNLNDLFQTISYEFSGDSNQLIRNSEFSIALPTALSVQFDYRVTNKIYINSSLVQPISMSDVSVVRPSQISLTPRFETNYFEVAMPVILYNYRYPRIGLSARFHKVIIGTDKLGGFFGIKDFTGMDFYIMVKLQFFKGNCRRFNKKFGCGNLEYKQQY
jgi:hypothetical protein